MWSSTRPAVAGPMPSNICNTRKPVTRSVGFEAAYEGLRRKLGLL